MKNDHLEKFVNNKIWIILLLVLLVRVFVYSFYNDYSIYVDTFSYETHTANILKGEVDALRTPIYPYIIKGIDMLTKGQVMKYKTITFVQEIVSIISIVVLYNTLKKTFKNENFGIVATIFYACLPAIFTYNKVILTESLSISLFIMYFCMILRYINNPTSKKTILIGIFTLLLIMLRPSFIYLIVALTLILLVIYILKKENKKQTLLGMGTLGCVGLALLGYCYLNKQNNNIFAISNVTHINQLDTVIGMGIYNTKDLQDQGIINMIEQKLDGEGATWYRATTNKIMVEYTPDEVDAYLKRCVKNNFPTYVVKTIKKAFTIAINPCDEIYLHEKSSEEMKPILYFAIIYLYVIFEIIYILTKIIKNKQIPLEQFTICIIVLGQLATIILGAQAEYSRLFVPVLPIVIISIIWHIDKKLKLNESENQQENG